MPTLRRIEDLVGARLDSVTFHDLTRLIDGRVVEDVDIDFKSEPYKEGQDFAADVAAMANTSGGVLIVGMREERGAAKELTPVALSDGETNRMKQWLAELVVPYLSTEMRQLPRQEDPSTGCYLVIVQRSPNAPHAVRKGTALRYYHRDGGRNRPLSEAEVADAYRNRFRGIETQAERLTTITSEGAYALRPDPSEIWLAMSLMPSSPGLMEVDTQALRAVRGFLGRLLEDGPFRSIPERISTGVGRVTTSSAFDHETGRPRSGYAELHTDGGGFVAIELHDATQPRGTDVEPTVRLNDAEIVRYGLGMLRFLAGHASDNATAFGDALALCQFVGPDQPGPVCLGYFDPGSSLWNVYEGSRALRRLPRVTAHAISLDAVSGAAVEWLAAGRLVLSDLMHAFGIAEVPQITSEGHLRLRYLHALRLDSWKAVADVPTTDESLAFYY